jgi:hypothetical protein
MYLSASFSFTIMPFLHTYIPLTLYPWRGSRGISNIHRGTHVLPKSFSYEEHCSKPIAVLLQSISGVSAINPLVAFYDIHGGKREVLFFYFVPDTRDDFIPFLYIFLNILYIKTIIYNKLSTYMTSVMDPR